MGITKENPRDELYKKLDSRVGNDIELWRLVLGEAGIEVLETVMNGLYRPKYDPTLGMYWVSKVFVKSFKVLAFPLPASALAV